MNMRELLFWILDSFKGGRIRRAYKEIALALNERDLNQKNKKIKKKIDILLEHANTMVPYYRDLDIKNFYQLPIVNKNIIKSNWENFISENCNRKKAKIVTTSGSTGTPFPIYIDEKKKERNSADTIYFSRLAGYSFGLPLLYMKIWVKERMESPITYKIRNICPIDVIKFSISDIDFVLRKIKNGCSSILAYASVLDIISKFFIDNDIVLRDKKPRAIIAMSETLQEETKRNLTDRCGVCVVSRYSNLECGIMAQQLTDGDSKFLINSASYYIEILKIDKDEPAEIGELGRIVVTDLYNYAQPMLRYDTGDIGSFFDEERIFFSKIEGRKLDLLYNTKGEVISSYVVYKNMWQYQEIDQYQLIQEGIKDYTIKISSNKGFTRSEKLISEFKEYLGADAMITIQFVNEIPLLSSGKRKKIVNNYRS